MSGLFSEPDAATVQRIRGLLDNAPTEPRLALLTRGEAHAVVELLEHFDANCGDGALTDIVRTLIIRILDRL